MDEKEIRTIGGGVYDKLHKNRKAFFNSKRDTWLSGYIQGALDQAPISRKKRTEEIIQIVKNNQSIILPGYPEGLTYVFGILDTFVKKIIEEIERKENG